MAAALICFVSVQISEIPVNRLKVSELLSKGGDVQASVAKVHSVGYYESLAEADVWQAGPGSQAFASMQKARTQDLSEVHSSFTGKIATSLVKACADGDDNACDKIASDSEELSALETADSKKSGALQTQTAQQSAAASTNAESTVASAKTAVASGNLWDTKNGIWDSTQWQSSSDIGDAVSSQWLKACTGNQFLACTSTVRKPLA